MMGDYTVTIVNDHMVILCQHYMGTYFNVIKSHCVGGTT